MFDVLRHKLNRRQFLSAGLAIAGGVAISPHPAFSATGQGRKELIRWALLSDTHTPANPDNRYHSFRPYRNLQEVVGQIAPNLPDGLLITGDVARSTGRKGSYENVKRLLAPVARSRPIHLAVGNHDNRSNFLRAFEGFTGDVEHVEGRHVVIANTGPVRMILLDSLMFVNLWPGQLGNAQRQWLETYLRTCDDRPTLLFVHHTLNGGNTDMLDADRLLEIIGPAAKVKAVIYGHSHALDFATYKGIHLINLPAIGYSFHDSQPLGWLDARLTARGGEFTVRAIGGNRELDGYTRQVEWRS
jgi:Icc protein